MKNIYDGCTKNYQITKTLVQELVPIGATLDNIKRNGFIERDIKRSDDFWVAKGFCNDYHREYIELSLRSAGVDKILPSAELLSLYGAYSALKLAADNKKLQRTYALAKTKMRQLISRCFKQSLSFSKAPFLYSVLPAWMVEKGYSQGDIDVVLSFDKFASYFDNYFTARARLYTSDDKAGVIAQRVVSNFEIYFDNCINFKRITKIDSVDFGLADIFDSLSVFGEDVSKFFKPSNAYSFLSQSDINQYNALVNGYSLEDGAFVKGFNSYIYEAVAKDKNHSGLIGFVKLQKQLLSNVNSFSFVPSFFESDKQVLDAMSGAVDLFVGTDGLACELRDSILSISKADCYRVYLKTQKIKYLSNAVFGSYKLIGFLLDLAGEGKKQVVSLRKIDGLVVDYANSIKKGDRFYELLFGKLKSSLPVQAWLVGSYIEIKEKLDTALLLVRPILKLEHIDGNRRLPGTRNDEDKGGKGFAQVAIIKDVLDCMKAFVWTYRPLHLVNNKKSIEVDDIDNSFYAGFLDSYCAIDELLFVLYNKVRNHLNTKPSNVKKVRLNFDNYKLLCGWSSGQQRASSSVLFEKQGKYYLGIIDQSNRGLFDYTLEFDDYLTESKKRKKLELLKEIRCVDGNGYNKVDYSMLSGFNKMAPKVFISALNRRDFFKPSQRVLDITNVSSHTKAGAPKSGFTKADFNLEDCHTVIDYFKDCLKIHPVWNLFEFSFSETSKYGNISEFYNEVEKCAYKISFTCIKNSFIDKAVEDGKLFLFQIYNKDFSEFSKGQDNLHTMYLRGLFEPNNLNDVTIKLNGGAQVFYRPRSISEKQKVVHKAREPIVNKNIYAKNKTATYKYDIIKNKRYTKDKFHFHFSITLNHQADKDNFLFNRQFNENVIRKNSRDVNVLSLKRGERNLLYYMVMDRKGNILAHDTMDVDVGVNGVKTDYQLILKDKEKLRMKSRKSWASLDNISDFKQGFLSTVVHRVTILMLKHNALLCVDGIDSAFKQSRMKFETNIYDRFICALVNKLNYLVFKDKEYLSDGHYLNAYQLAAKFESLKMIGKQSGALLLVNPSFTSSMCPNTGFVNLLRFKYKNMIRAKQYLSKFDSFVFNGKTGNFDVSFDYKKIFTSRNFGDYKTKWVVATHGKDRFYYDKANKEFKELDVTSELSLLLDGAGINLEDGKDLLGEIMCVGKASFFMDLFFLMNQVVKMRQLNSHDNIDYIISPILDDDGYYYDSRRPIKGLPDSTDANGAYLMGLKGLWAIEQIVNTPKDERVELFLDNEQYFNYVMTYCKPRS